FFSVSATNPEGGTCTFVPANAPFIDHWATPCYEAPTMSLAPGAWHLACYAYDGAGTVTFYDDGNAVTVNGSLYDYGLDTLYLGSQVTGGTTTQPSLLGALDEV